MRKASLQLARPRKEKHNYGKRRNHLGPRNDCRYMCAANWVTVACSCSPTGSRTVTFARVIRVDAVIPTSGLVSALQPVLRGAQRTYGTTDPGGVWHPVHRRECLTILLGTYAENTNHRHGRRTAICIRYSLLVPVPPFLPIGICGSKSHQELLYRTGSFRVSETGCAINKGFFSSGIPASCISFQSTCGIEPLIECSE